MSEPFQSGFHPDADQICAFVEHALPAHEQEQMLDHLAACSECRAAVALSLPPIEEPVQRPAASRLKPWWSGWRLAWLASVAAAALVLTVLYIHQASVAPKTSAPAQIAESRLPAPHAPQGQSPTLAAKQPVRSAPNQSALMGRSTSDFKPGVESPRKAETINSSEHNGAHEIQSRSSVLLDKLSQPSPMPTASHGQGAGMGAGSGGSISTSVGKVPTAVAGALLQKTAPEQRAEKSGASAASSVAPTGIGLSGGNSQTVAVGSAAPAVQTEAIEANDLRLAENEAKVTQFVQLEHPLPSGIPALSAAMQARRIVAIDLRNGIFLSKDGGKHWQAIHPQWQGRAVRVERVLSAAANITDLKLGREPEPTAMKAAGAAPAANTASPLLDASGSPLAASGASLTGTVTDMTGAVVPGTSISVIESTTHTAHTVNTDQTGHYLVDGLAPGAYAVEAKAPGFVNQSVADVAVTADHQNVANLSLKIGDVTESVTVSAASIEPVTEIAAQRTSVKAEKRAAPAASPTPPPVFAITTDNGERWTSADGLTWKRP